MVHPASMRFSGPSDDTVEREKQQLLSQHPELRNKSAKELYDSYCLETAFDKEFADVCRRLAQLMGYKEIETRQNQPSTVAAAVAATPQTTIVKVQTAVRSIEDAKAQLRSRAMDGDLDAAYEFACMNDDAAMASREAIYYLESAAKQGHAQSALKLSKGYKREYLQIAVDNGQGDTRLYAMYLLACDARDTKGEGNLPLARKHFKAVAESNYTNLNYKHQAAQEYSHMAYKGLGGEVNIEEACAFAPQNSTVLHFKHALRNEKARTPQSLITARHYYKKVADLDDPLQIVAEAALHYADMATQGIGGPRDDDEAKAYYKKAADGGQEHTAPVQGRAANMYAFRLWQEDLKLILPPSKSI